MLVFAFFTGPISLRSWILQISSIGCKDCHYRDDARSNRQKKSSTSLARSNASVNLNTGGMTALRQTHEWYKQAVAQSLSDHFLEYVDATSCGNGFVAREERGTVMAHQTWSISAQG